LAHLGRWEEIPKKEPKGLDINKNNGGEKRFFKDVTQRDYNRVLKVNPRERLVVRRGRFLGTRES